MDRNHFKERVRDAASSDWPGVISAISGVDPGFFDGNHQPCPKCPGVSHDRFRLFDDGSGGAICNQCFTTNNFDGFATIAWLCDCSFPEAINKVARYCHIEIPDFAPRGRVKTTNQGSFVGVNGSNSGKPKQTNKKPKAKFEEDLTFEPWNETLAQLWCMQNTPITTQAMKQLGTRFAKFRNQHPVFAFPGKDESGTIVSWTLVHRGGGMLPTKDGPRKTRLSSGSRKSIIGENCGDRVVWKVEGPKDLLAFLSSDPPAGHSAFTTANGATDNPFPWMLTPLAGKLLAVVGDADNAGEIGAEKWAKAGATFAADCRIAKLPFEVQPNHGADLRDFFNQGNRFRELVELVKVAESVRPAELKKKDQPGGENDSPSINESPTDPHRLARINIELYRTTHHRELRIWRGEWLKYRNGCYTRITEEELRARITAAVRSEFERLFRDELAEWEEAGSDPEKGPPKIREVRTSLINNVIQATKSMCMLPSSVDMPSWIPDRQAKKRFVSLSNGILDLDSVFAGKDFVDCMIDHTPDWFSTVKLNYPCDENAKCPRFMEFINSSMEGDVERIRILQEWAGYLLTPTNREQRFLALEGEGGNGKTVFFAAMIAMLGPQNVSHVPLERFGGQFDLATTIGKAANICGDVGEIDRVAEAELKQFTGGDVMQFDRKRIDPITVRPTAKLMMSWNNRPRFRDRSQGVWRRMLLIPFNYSVPRERMIRGLDTPEWWLENNEVSGILNWAIAGLHRLTTQGRFSKSTVSKSAMDDYQRESNPAQQFLDEFLFAAENGQVCRNRIYDLYVHYCKKTGNRYPLNKFSFGKEVMKAFPQAKQGKMSEGGERKNSYVGICFSTDEVLGEKVRESYF